MQKAVVIIAAAIFIFNFSTAFGKNCKKGKPCGNSCIAAYKTCRYGSVGSYYSRHRSYSSSTPKSYSGGGSYTYAPRVDDSGTHNRSNTSGQKESIEAKDKKVQNDYEVIKDRVIARRLPESDDITGILHKGDIVRIYDESGTWVQVSKGRIKQWIERTSIAIRKTK